MYSVQSACWRTRLNIFFLAFAALPVVNISIAGCDSSIPTWCGKGNRVESPDGRLVRYNNLQVFYHRTKNRFYTQTPDQVNQGTFTELSQEVTNEVLRMAEPQNIQQSPISSNSTTTTTTTTHLGSPQGTTPSPRSGHSTTSATLPLTPLTPVSASSTTTIITTSSSSSSSNNPATPAQPIQPLGDGAAAIASAPTVARYNPIITVGAAGIGLTLEQIAKKNGDTEKKAFAKGLVATGAASLLGQQAGRTPETTAQQLAADLATYTIGHYVIAYVWPKQKTSETPTEILPEAATQTTETVQPKLVEKKGCPVTSWLRSTILSSRK